MERPRVLRPAGSGRQHDQRRYPQRGQGGRPPPAVRRRRADRGRPDRGRGHRQRLRRRNGQIWLMPENDNYSPIDGTNAEIIGIVKAVVREY